MTDERYRADIVTYLIQKARPMKPYFEESNQTYVCPACKNKVDKSDFCKKCGQYLDWSCDDD